MPQAIPIVIAYTATVIGTNIAAGAIIVGLNTWLVNATLLTILTQAAVVLSDQGQRSLDVSLAARLTSNPTEIAPRRIIYGKTRVAPQPVMVDDSSNFIVAYAICEHDIKSIDNLYINNGKFLSPDEIDRLTGGGQVGVVDYDETADGPDLGIERKNFDDDDYFHGELLFRFVRPGGGISHALTRMGTNLDVNNMHGDTTAFLVVKYPKTTSNPDRTKQLIFPGVPNLQLDIDRGNVELADLPSQYQVTNSTYNSARALYDYTKKYTDYGETVLGKERIDYASFASAMTACDTEGYEAHGMVTLTDSNEAVFEQFMMAMGMGWVADSGGVLVAKANTSENAVRTITADHVLPGWSAVPQTPRGDRFSDLTITYINDSNEIDTLTYHLQEARDQFGEKEQTVEASLVRGSEQAYKLATILADRVYHSTQLNLPLGIYGLALNAGDIVSVDIDQLGLDHERLFYVVERTINPNTTTDISLAEYNAPPDIPTRTAVEADISLSDRTATMDVETEIPKADLPGTGAGDEMIDVDTVLWETTFEAERRGGALGTSGFSSGTDTGSPSGSRTGGDSLTMPSGTITGLGGRTITVIQTWGISKFVFGWEPDTESEDQSIIPDDVRLVVETGGEVLFDGQLNAARIEHDGTSLERFAWDEQFEYYALGDGDAFTAKLVTRAQGPNPDFYDGLVLQSAEIAPTVVSSPALWEMTVNVANGPQVSNWLGETGWSSGTGDYPSSSSFGTIVSGSPIIAANTIPGITGQRTVSAIFSYLDPDTDDHGISLGWEPDSESTDAEAISDDVFFSVFSDDGIERIRVRLNGAFVENVGDSTEAFRWTNLGYDLPTSASLNPTKFRIWIPPISDYHQTAHLTTVYDGTTTVAQIPDDLRVALFDIDRPSDQGLKRSDGLLFDAPLKDTDTTATTSSEETTITSYLEGKVSARALDTVSEYHTQPTADGNTYRLVYYRASGPLPVDLLKS